MKNAHTHGVIAPIFHEARHACLVGPGASFKSFLALYLALLASAGHRQNGVAALKTTVLYLDWEEDKETVGARLQALQTGHPELAQVRPLYRRCIQPLRLEAHHIAAEVRRLGVGLVIVDNAAMASGGDPNNPESALPFQRAVQRLGCASLTLAHPPALTTDGYDRFPYGSAWFRGQARNVWAVMRPEGSDQVVLSQIGSACKNSFGRNPDPLGFEFSFQPDRVTIAAFSPAETAAGDRAAEWTASKVPTPSAKISRTKTGGQR